MSSPSRLRLAPVLLGLPLLLITACLGEENPSGPEDPGADDLDGAPTVDAETSGWMVRCTVDPVARGFSCGNPGAEGESGAQRVIVGNNPAADSGYVTLANDPVEISGNTLSADVWVRNLLPQPLGTTDPTGTTATGIRVFFHTLPDNGVSVANQDGTGTFTGSGQPYFQYDRVAQAFDRTVRKTWQFTLPNPAQAFTFEVYVDADVPFPDGWVEVSPGDEGLAVAEGLQLTATAYNVVGAEEPSRSFTWSTSDAGIVSVNSTGLATGVGAGGPAEITATSDGPETAGVAAITVGGNDVEVVLGVIPDAVDEGGVLQHFLVVTNHGPEELTNARVRLDIASSVYPVGADPQCNATGNPPPPGTRGFNCDLTFVPSGFGYQIASAFVEVRASDAAIITSTATLDQIDGGDDLSSDPRADNNVSEATTIVEDVPDGNLSISLTDSPDPVEVGATLEYVVSVSNPGTERATRVVVDLHIDDNGETTLLGGSLPAGCEPAVSFDDPSDTVIRCDLGLVAPAATVDSPTLSVIPGAGLGGTTLNATATFRVIEGMYDANAVNESAAATTAVNPAS